MTLKEEVVKLRNQTEEAQANLHYVQQYAAKISEYSNLEEIVVKQMKELTIAFENLVKCVNNLRDTIKN